ncbi:MAG TPA: hypothetical protein VEF34_04050 [Syntrophobacteraceae bacterium]|nr:hypothetical protein [Syntrophobacteraceae bacterium]
MNRITIYAILTALLIGAGWMQPNAQAANWYVDPNATGSNTGASWANAWTAFSSITWGSGGVQAGDTLYISGGSSSQTYTSPLTIGASGTSGSQITIATGALSPSPYGYSGTVIFDAGNTQANSPMLSSTQSYVTINGNDGDGNINWQFQNAYRPVGGGNSTDNNIMSLSSGGSYTGNKVLYVAFHDVASALYAASNCSFEVAHCSFYNILGNQAISTIGSCSATLGNILIHHNSIQINCDPNQGYYGPDGIESTYGTDAYNNTFTAITTSNLGIQHPDFIQWDFHYDRAWNNTFFTATGAYTNSVMFPNFTASPAAITNFTFVNNVLNNIQYEGLAFSDGGGPTTISNLTIANNTFVDCIGGGNYPMRVSFGASSSVSNAIIENNIFYDSGSKNGNIQVILVDATTEQQAGITFDYNNVNAGTNGNTELMWDNNGSWTAISQAHGQTGAPSFVSYTPHFQTNNYQLSSSDTACRGEGVNLNSISLLTRDIAGSGRPSTGAWDIGAFELNASTIQPPHNLRLSN